MNADALRNWGIWVSSALILAALAIASPWRAPAPVSASSLQGDYQTAQAEASPAAPAPISLIVRFRGRGPIAHAQALAANGRLSEAARQVQIQLARQTAFNGLCFDRFTVGGAEIVLRSCADVAPGERAALQTRWLARLNAMHAVEYADVNAAATPARAPG
jgi:hypothetical protein